MQFTFENPQSLWFLLSLPLLLLGHYFFLRYTKKRALHFANFRALKRITGKKLITKNYLQLILRCFIVIFAIGAASGTVLWIEGFSNENDYVIAIDTSSSMTSQDIPPTRIDAAKNDAKLFLESLNSDTRVGVVSFSGIALIQTVPTSDKELVTSRIDEVEILPAGGTDIPSAIITSTNLLLDNSKGRAIILITDGSNTIETFLDESLSRALDYAQEYKVKIHTVGIGTQDGPVGYLPEYYNVSATFNEDNLIQIANATDGTYNFVESEDQLFAAFQQISLEQNEQLLRRDLRPLFMLTALLLLFVEWLLINTRWRVLP